MAPIMFPRTGRRNWNWDLRACAPALPPAAVSAGSTGPAGGSSACARLWTALATGSPPRCPGPNRSGFGKCASSQPSRPAPAAKSGRFASNQEVTIQSKGSTPAAGARSAGFQSGAYPHPAYRDFARHLMTPRATAPPGEGGRAPQTELRHHGLAGLRAASSRCHSSSGSSSPTERRMR